MLSNRRDPEATKAAGFVNRKSFVTFAGHTHLVGYDDHHAMRWRLYERCRGRCEVCRGPMTWQQMEWHHAQKTFGGKRCDGLCCAVAAHEACHPKKRVQWTPSKSNG